ncbi:hypothetical protein EVAR_172_1 [Eumeta japonica]|uniref:Uncharacterized protein n=1 Tax=Eumeta variegata TaxID=151549 RepID=A0A4C1SC26_EUMVA|nr:hypothetical protein EVAR_172_1 [Eumeta japonica]
MLPSKDLYQFVAIIIVDKAGNPGWVSGAINLITPEREPRTSVGDELRPSGSRRAVIYKDNRRPRKRTVCLSGPRMMLRSRARCTSTRTSKTAFSKLL